MEDPEVRRSVPEVRWRRDWSRPGKRLAVLPPIRVSAVPLPPTTLSELVDSDLMVVEQDERRAQRDERTKNMLLMGAGFTWGFATVATSLEYFAMRGYDVQGFARHALVVLALALVVAGATWWLALSTFSQPHNTFSRWRRRTDDPVAGKHD